LDRCINHLLFKMYSVHARETSAIWSKASEETKKVSNKCLSFVAAALLIPLARNFANDEAPEPSRRWRLQRARVRGKGLS
jgi:hypothetical protein